MPGVMLTQAVKNGASFGLKTNTMRDQVFHQIRRVTAFARKCLKTFVAGRIICILFGEIQPHFRMLYFRHDLSAAAFCCCCECVGLLNTVPLLTVSARGRNYAAAYFEAPKSGTEIHVVFRTGYYR